MARSYVSSRRPEFTDVIRNRVVNDQLVAKQFEPGQTDPNSPYNYKDISSAPFMGRLVEVVIPIQKAPKIRKSVFKRTEDGIHQVALISCSSLFRLISAVHFQSGKKGKVVKWSSLTDLEKSIRVDITTKVKLRVLMAIGPVSGL